ncbi:hypothetical protein ACU686_42990 [Yinghuangia aomiensis]
MDGASGACYFVDGDGTVLLAATQLDLLLEFVWRLKTDIDAGHLGEDWTQCLIGDLRKPRPRRLRHIRGQVAQCHQRHAMPLP